MRFGLRKLTLLDYPGEVACTVFTGGCNFRCPFCHNASLVRGIGDELELDHDGLLDFINKRAKMLDGICITGGEPLLHPELPNLLMELKQFGLKIKLDTNGSFPGRLQSVVAEGLVDMVAMDIKNTPSKYDMTAGHDGAFDMVCDSVAYLLQNHVSYEFRTTVVGGFHEVSDFDEIGRWLKGCQRYFLQKFEDSGDTLMFQDSMANLTPEFMQDCLAAVRKHLPQAELRGA